MHNFRVTFQTLATAAFFLFIVAAPVFADQAYEGTYILDQRTTDEHVGFTSEITITDMGGGRYGFSMLYANPALCGGSYEGQGEVTNGQGVFQDMEIEFRVSFAGDKVTVQTNQEVTPDMPNHCPLSGEYWRKGVYPQATEKEIVDRIREHYAYINETVKDSEPVTCELQGYSTEGGELQGWLHFTEEYVKKTRATLYGEMGRRVIECYYWDNDPVFCFEAMSSYDKPFGEVVSVEENRYYFHHGEMVRWLDKNKQQVSPDHSFFPQAREEIYWEAVRYKDAILQGQTVMVAP